MSITGFQVLILKASPEEGDEEDPYIKALSHLKIPATIIPTLQFRFMNIDILQKYLSCPENYAGLLISSPRCANAIIEAFHELGSVQDKWKALKCFTVGETTARLIKDALQLVPEGSSAGSMANLLQLVAQYSLNKVLLMPCGNLHKEIPEEKEIKLEKVVVYETCEHVKLKDNLCEKLNNDIPSLITFFSPSGVSYALPYIPQSLYPIIKFIAIGPTTAKELESRNIPVSGLCGKPTPDSLTQTVLKVMNVEPS